MHLGVTETGTAYGGVIKSAVGIGTLLMEGIGDTVRVSLTADPVEEARAGVEILKASGLKKGGIRFVSCPTCGRTEIDLIGLAHEVEERLRGVERDITVAVMGCVVNGPGEAREADYGVAGAAAAACSSKRARSSQGAGGRALLRAHGAHRKRGRAMSANAVGFLEIFPDCAGLSGLCGGLDKAEVTSVVVNSAELTMEVEALFTRAPAPAELSSLENELREEYGLASVRIEADYPRAAQEKQPGGASRVLYGKAIKEPKLVEMSALNLESGTVAVKGEVFAVNNREIQKRGAYVLSFDMTDYTAASA